ncbi:hypothetical protein [Vreelandella sp. EE22]
MAEYCRNCAVELEGEEIASKYYRGFCKPGESYWELCEGCGGFVEIDHNGWRLGTRRSLEEISMEQQNLPDRERWFIWVAFAWGLAVIACLASIYLISEFGYIEIPSSSSRFVTTREPNVLIWSVGIGQAVGSIFFAVVVHMIYSIHQNTCDQLTEISRQSLETMSGQVETEEAIPGQGLRLVSVQSTSPLRGAFKAGYIIESVNDKAVVNLKQAESLVKPGRNKFEFMTAEGQRYVNWVHLKPGPWLVEGEPVEAPQQE